MRRLPPFRDVYTLNVRKLVETGQRWLDFSSISNPTIRIHGNSSEFERAQLPYAFQPTHESTDKIRSPRQLWPPYSKGFLYYHSPKDKPPIAGELRIRLTPSNDPTTFDQGNDLPTSQSLINYPWNRSLYTLATTKSLRPLYLKLLNENLVPISLDSAIQALPKLTFMYSRCQIIHTLNDPFILDLSAEWITLAAISQNGLETIRLLRLFMDHRIDQSPYSGSLLARFEPSGESNRTIVLRFLEELSPVRSLLPSYDGYIEKPSPNLLFSKQFYGKPRPWSVDLDIDDKGKLAIQGLNLLWDATPGLQK